MADLANAGRAERNDRPDRANRPDADDREGRDSATNPGPSTTPRRGEPGPATTAALGAGLGAAAGAIGGPVGAAIGAISLSGSLIAWAKLDGKIEKTWRMRGQQGVNATLFVATLAVGAYIIFSVDGHAAPAVVAAFFIGALVFGVLMTMPIGGADMPVVISLYNAFTGLAVGFEGYVLQNPALMIAGMVVGSAGTLPEIRKALGG